MLCREDIFCICFSPGTWIKEGRMSTVWKNTVVTCVCVQMLALERGNLSGSLIKTTDSRIPLSWKIEILHGALKLIC